jgi:pilus assembly protein Flp/PilA
MNRWLSGMAAAKGAVARLVADESGQDLIEYGLIVAFIALGSVVTMKGLATSLGTFFGGLGTTLTSSV